MFDEPRPSIPHDAKSQQDGKARIRRATLPPLHQQRSRLAAGKPVRWGPGRFESRRLGGCHESRALGGYQGKKKLPAQMKFAQQMELHLLLKVGPRPCICRTLSHSSCRPATPNACTLSVNATSTQRSSAPNWKCGVSARTLFLTGPALNRHRFAPLPYSSPVLGLNWLG